MKTVLRDNLVLVAGIALPVLLLFLFLVAAWLPGLLQPNPKYDFLYVVHNASYHSRAERCVTYQIKDRSVVAYSRQVAKDGYCLSERLFRFDSTKLSSVEITVIFPNSEFGTMQQEQIVKEVAGIIIDTNQVSPDGYRLEGPRYDYSPWIFDLFGGGSRNSSLRLTKGARNIAVNEGDQYYYYGNNYRFIGWLIER